MQPDLSRKVIRMLVERILRNALPKESGAARLQQIGLFTLIYMFQGDKEPVTVSRLSRITGQGDAQINRHLRKLMDEELVERTQILNRQGRGRAFHLSIKQTPKTKRLLAAIDKATVKKKR
jgi:DNA-binding transcriptional ArsR family regulator